MDRMIVPPRGAGVKPAPSAVLGAEDMTSKGMVVTMPLLVRHVEVLAALEQLDDGVEVPWLSGSDGCARAFFAYSSAFLESPEAE
jgi:hypothetical protein